MSSRRLTADIPASVSKIEGDCRKLPAYRTEWRHNLVCHWVIVGSYATYGDAIDACDAAREKWAGQVRVVAQHVTYAEGLGA